MGIVRAATWRRVMWSVSGIGLILSGVAVEQASAAKPKYTRPIVRTKVRQSRPTPAEDKAIVQAMIADALDFYGPRICVFDEMIGAKKGDEVAFFRPDNAPENIAFDPYVKEKRKWDSPARRWTTDDLVQPNIDVRYVEQKDCVGGDANLGWGAPVLFGDTAILREYGDDGSQYFLRMIIIRRNGGEWGSISRTGAGVWGGSIYMYDTLKHKISSPVFNNPWVKAILVERKE